MDASCIDFPLYAFVKRTRASQKTSKTSGRTVRIKYKVALNKAGDRCWASPTVESNLNGRFDGPRITDPAAMNRPKHMRQKCRAMRQRFRIMKVEGELEASSIIRARWRLALLKFPTARISDTRRAARRFAQRFPQD